MNGDDRAILLGMIFGDGHVRPDPRGSNSATLTIKHSAKQAEYARYKAILLGNILGGKTPTPREIDNNGFPGLVFSKTNSYLRILHGWLYSGGVKKLSPYVRWLTPEGLAIWYMDDGNLGKKIRRGKVHAVDLYLNCHTDKEEAEAICQEIEKRFGIKFLPHLNNGKYRIRCGTREARKFVEIVAPFIHGSLAYKISILEKSTSARHLAKQRDDDIV